MLTGVDTLRKSGRSVSRGKCCGIRAVNQRFLRYAAQNTFANTWNTEDLSMGRGDSRNSSKMRRLKAQTRLKNRIKNRRAAAAAARAEKKASAAPVAAPAVKAGKKVAH